MTRQYCGARYVPLIDGEWDPNKPYEPLTIVTYYGNSYTSKVAVPAGTLPTDTAYWAKTGNFNAQLEQVEANVAQNTKDIEILKRHSYKQGEGLIIGDDIFNPNNSNIMGILVERLKNSFVQFSGTWNSNLGFSTSAISIGDFVTTLTYDKPENVSNVYIIMGLADFIYFKNGGDVPGLASNLQSNIAKIYTKFPNCTIEIFYDGINPSDYNACIAGISAYRNLKGFGVKYTQWSANVLFNEDLWGNGTLTANGYLEFMDYVNRSIDNGYAASTPVWNRVLSGLGSNVDSIANEYVLQRYINNLVIVNNYRANRFNLKANVAIEQLKQGLQIYTCNQVFPAFFGPGFMTAGWMQTPETQVSCVFQITVHSDNYYYIQVLSTAEAVASGTIISAFEITGGTTTDVLLGEF